MYRDWPDVLAKVMKPREACGPRWGREGELNSRVCLGKSRVTMLARYTFPTPVFREARAGQFCSQRITERGEEELLMTWVAKLGFVSCLT